jgi:RHS repeat-associated protein
MMDLTGQSPAVYFTFVDGLGSVTALSNMNGQLVERYVYDAFGNTQILDAGLSVLSASAVGNSILFTGRRLDVESGLYDYRARIYSPALGRFLQTDPLGTIDGMNLYQYCGNNPVNFVDPLGQWGKPEHYRMTYMAFRRAGYSHHDAQIAALASARVDNNLLAHFTGAKHYLEDQDCDSEYRIHFLMNKAMEAEAKGKHELAMKYLGQAAHTRQDQYAHAKQNVKGNMDHFLSGKDPDNIAKHQEEFRRAYETTKDLIKQYLSFLPEDMHPKKGGG